MPGANGTIVRRLLVDLRGEVPQAQDSRMVPFANETEFKSMVAYALKPLMPVFASRVPYAPTALMPPFASTLPFPQIPPVVPFARMVAYAHTPPFAVMVLFAPMVGFAPMELFASAARVASGEQRITRLIWGHRFPAR